MSQHGAVSEHTGTRAAAGGPPAGWWPLAAIVLAVFMLMLDATVVTVAIPDMRRDLHAGLGGLEWVLNAYTLAMAAFQLTAGSLADRLGRRRTFLAGVLVFAVSSLACGLAPTMPVLIAARVVQGLAGAAMFATTLALIAQCYQGQARGIAFGIRGTAAGTAVVLGPVVGGVLVSALSWRWVFLVNLPVAAVTAVIGWRRLPRAERLNRGQRLDLGGPVLLAATLVLLIFALLRAEGDGWASAPVVAMFAGSAAALAAFLLAERHHPGPMLDIRLFRDPSFTGTQAGSFTIQASIFALLVYLSLFFQDHLRYSALRTGLCFLLLVVPILLAGPAAGALMDRLPRRYLVAGALTALAAGIAFMDGLEPRSTWTHLAAGLIVAGLACGTALPVLGSLAVEVADQRHLGMAAGVNNTMLQVGSAAGIAVYGAILGPAAATSPGLASGLNHLFVIAAIVAACGAVLTFTLIRTPRPARAESGDTGML
jgi:EmrB/QacA subfamily drug resistance transporter